MNLYTKRLLMDSKIILLVPKNMFKPSNIKYPQFFKFAKGKKSSSLEVYTNSPMDRIPQYIDIEVGRKHMILMTIIRIRLQMVL